MLPCRNEHVATTAELPCGVLCCLFGANISSTYSDPGVCKPMTRAHAPYEVAHQNHLTALGS